MQQENQYQKAHYPKIIEPSFPCIQARKSIKPKLIQNPSDSEIRSNYVGPLLVLLDLMQIEWRD